MSHTLVVLMVRSGIPMDVWMRQPDGCIETAVQLYTEQDEHDQDAAQPGRGTSYSG